MKKLFFLFFIFIISYLNADYIKILSYNPLKIKTTSSYKKGYIKTKKYYINYIDIFDAVSPIPFIKKNLTPNVTLKIAQFNKNSVRIVYFSKIPLKLSIKKQKNLLIIDPNLKYISVSSSKKIIVIDPGHGGKDSGGIGIGKKYEKNAVLAIAKKLKYYLQKEGYIVYLTRSKDIFKELKWRTHFANKKKASLFISIHCNIAPHHIKSPHGIETYFLSPTKSKKAMRVAQIENKEIKGLNSLDKRVILNFLNKDRIIASNKLGIDVQANILATLRKYYTHIKDGGVRPAPFWVLVGTQMPAILIETGYLTNPMEAKRLFNPQYQRLLAKGIARGVKNYFLKNK